MRLKFVKYYRAAYAGAKMALAAFVAVSAAHEVRSQAIEILVSAPESGLTPVTLAGDDLSTLFDQAVGREAELRAFVGRVTVAEVAYLGVPGAIQVTIAADGNSAELFIPSTGFQMDFEEVSPESLQAGVEAFLRTEGSASLAEFRKEINKRSLLGVSDGNPHSTTALLSRSFSEAFAESEFSSAGSARVFSVRAESSRWSTGKWEGRTHSLGGQINRVLSPRYRWFLNLPIDYRRFGSAKIWGGSLGTGLVYDVIARGPQNNWRWSVGPLLGAAVRGSEQLGAGGALATVGLNSVVSVATGRRSRLGLMAQASSFEGIPVDFEGFELDSEIDQAIGELGVHYLHRSQRRSFHASLTGTRFLRAAAVEAFGTARLSLILPLTGTGRFELQVAHMRGDDFEDTSARVGISW